MLESGIKIVRTTEKVTYDAALQKTTELRVEFTVDGHGPFTEYFPKPTFSAIERDNRLNAFAREVRAS